MQILPTVTTGRHFHIMAGVAGVMPFADLAFDDSAEAVIKFMALSESLASGRIVPTERFAAEQALYHAFDNQTDYGVFVDAPPFRVLIMDCTDDCHSPILN